MRWLLGWLVSDADRRAIEGDLAELFEVRRRSHGDRAARRWLRRQRLLCLVHVVADRILSGAYAMLLTLRHLGRDLTYSIRSLGRTPALTATIVLTVGIGLGATTAMVGVVQAVLINPLPYADGESLLWIYTDSPPYRFRFSVVDYRALEADHPAFSEIAAYQTRVVTITEASVGERVTIRDVTGSYFPILRLKPILGRLFDPSDDPRDDRSVVLTHDFWMTRFGGDPGVLGRALAVEGTDYTIVGVLQKSDGPFERDIALFTAARWPPPRRKGPFFTNVLGRLAPGASRATALQTLRATNARLFPIWRSSYQDEKATWSIQDLKARVVGDVGSTLLLVLTAVACVLLIACANAINLLIARAQGRGRELAIRGALGASRGRLIQHLLAETAVLTTVAMLVGLAVAGGAIALISSFGGPYIPRIAEVRLSPPVLGWLGSIAILSGLLIGLVPAVHSSRLHVDRTLASGGRAASDGPAARQLRRALVAAEFALATPLLVGAALVLTSLNRLNAVDVGIETGRILTAGVALPAARYPDDPVRRAFWDRALARLGTLPGVEAVALTDARPPDGAQNQNNFDLEDRPSPAGQNQPICPWVAASPDYFKATGLRLERGRFFDTRDFDFQNGIPAIIVDRAWANRFFPGEEVLGRRLREGGCTTCVWTTVIGVVGTVKYSGLDAPDDGTVYYPFLDVPNGYLVLRAAADPALLSNPLRQAVRQLDPSLALSEVATGDELVSDSLAAPRYLTILIGMFALTAVVLSVVGVYGVMAHFVQQHARDMGIRLALGAEPSGLRRSVVLQGLQLVVAGIAVGIALAFYTGRTMTTMLFGVSPTDPPIMAGIPAALLLVAAAACLVPARRAAAVDPAQILRES